ncbi:hypothetical protein D3C74_71510 [compost metagenome]
MSAWFWRWPCIRFRSKYARLVGSNLIEANAERKRARFNRLLPEWLTRSDLIDVPDWRVVGTNLAQDAVAEALGNVLPEVSRMMIAAVLTATPGMNVRTG